VVAVAPLVVATGLVATAFTQQADASWVFVIIWAAALFVVGTGVGMAWPHLSAWIMGYLDDPVESGAAAAAINTVQLISGAIGAGLAGVVVNMVAAGDVWAARWLFGVFAVLAALGGVASYRSIRH
jgi:MFS family permease